MEIIQLTNQDERFYPLLGPFLARREVEKEIGYRIYDDDGKVWFVALEDGRVIGFCYRLEKPKGTFQIGSCYTVPEHRGKGVFQKLLDEALKGISGHVHLTTKNPVIAEMLEKRGFVVRTQKGTFKQYGREI